MPPIDINTFFVNYNIFVNGGLNNVKITHNSCVFIITY